MLSFKSNLSFPFLLGLIFLTSQGLGQNTIPNYNENNKPGSFYAHKSNAESWVKQGTKNWMSMLPNSTKLKDVSIPGTHDLGARYGGDIVEAQSWTVKEQLNAGIRFLDIRESELLKINLQSTTVLFIRKKCLVIFYRIIKSNFKFGSSSSSCNCPAKTFKTQSAHSWVEFRLPQRPANTRIQISDGAYNKYKRGKCNRVFWKGLTFTCNPSSCRWEQTAGRRDADAKCTKKQWTSPYVFVGNK